jgi:hypothetical protein
MSFTVMDTAENVSLVNAWRDSTSLQRQPLRAMAAIDQEKVIAGTMLGSGLTRDIADGDSLSKSVGSPEQLKLFRASPANGLTSIIGVARKKSGFNPSDPESTHSSTAFREFSRQLHSCPILQFDVDSIEKEAVEKSDFNGLIKRVSNLVKAAISSDADKIQEGITQLVETAASKHKADEQKNLFVSSIIEGDGGATSASKKATLSLSFTQVHLLKDDSKGIKLEQSSFSVAIMKIVLDGQNWARFAEPFWNETFESLTSWVTSSRSPKGDVPHNLCIR